MENIDIDKMGLYLNSFIPEYKNKAGIFLCLTGSADVMVNNQVYHIERGILYVISPLITIYNVNRTADFTGIHITDDMEIFYSMIHSIIDTILHLKLRSNPCIQLDDDDLWFIVSQNERIEKKRQLMASADDEEERHLVRQLIHLLEQETILEVISIYFRTKKVEPQPIDKHDAAVYRFIYSLHTHFKTERTVAFYAAEVQLSSGHFTAIVKQKTGKTPSEWITAITLSQAKLLLEKTPKSIKEIASDLNFPEQFTFRKYFKQYVGVPPKEYRIRILEKKIGEDM